MSTCIETGSCIYKNMLNSYLVVGFYRYYPLTCTLAVYLQHLFLNVPCIFSIDILFEHIFHMCKDLASLQVDDHYFTIPFSHQTVAIGCIHLEWHLWAYPHICSW